MDRKEKYNRKYVDDLVASAISELKLSLLDNKDLGTLLHYRENAYRYIQEAIDYHYKFYPMDK